MSVPAKMNQVLELQELSPRNNDRAVGIASSENSRTRSCTRPARVSAYCARIDYNRYKTVPAPSYIRVIRY